jgi:hypothetical protein
MILQAVDEIGRFLLALLQDNGMDSPLKDGITMCQAGRLTNQLST